MCCLRLPCEAEPRHQAAELWLHGRLSYREIVQHLPQLVLSHPPGVALVPVHESAGTIAEEVVADQSSARSEPSDELPQRLLPLDDVVQHAEREGGVEGSVGKGQAGRFGPT